MKKKILSRIRVLDLSRVLAGPYCAQILSDQGAEIIKVESPEGDETRRWGPPFLKGESAYFSGMNRNKKSIVLNLRETVSQKALHQLLARSDILIENFKPGDLKKFGLSDALIRKQFPQLIRCQISGFGLKGDFKNFLGYDAAIQAWSGLMSINGTLEPTKVGVPIVDMVTGQNAAFAIMADLFERTQSGEGQKIETSLLENAFSILHPQTSNYFFSHQDPKRLGNTHPNIAPYQLFQTRTIGIYIACGNDRQFFSLCKVLGYRGSLDRFLTNELRVKNRKLLENALAPLILRQSARPLSEKLLKHGVPAGPAHGIKEALNLKQVQSLKLVVQKNNRSFIMPPFQFSRSQRQEPRPAPLLGGQTKLVLRDLDLTQAEMKNILSQQNVSKRSKK